MPRSLNGPHPSYLLECGFLLSADGWTLSPACCRAVQRSSSTPVAGYGTLSFVLHDTTVATIRCCRTSRPNRPTLFDPSILHTTYRSTDRSTLCCGVLWAERGAACAAAVVARRIEHLMERSTSIRDCVQYKLPVQLSQHLSHTRASKERLDTQSLPCHSELDCGIRATACHGAGDR